MEKRIEDSDAEEKRDFIESLQDLLHGYAVVLRKRTWCAQAMLPICPELIFCEAMPKKKERSALKWDEIRNDPEKKNQKQDSFFLLNKKLEFFLFNKKNKVAQKYTEEFFAIELKKFFAIELKKVYK